MIEEPSSAPEGRGKSSPPELDKDRVRLALMDGQFYSTTVTTHPQEERDRSKIPEISKIVYYPGTATLVVEAEFDGRSVAREDYTWVSAGGKTVQAEGTELELDETDGLGKYVRVEIRGEGGTAYTQPLGIRPRPEYGWIVSSCRHVGASATWPISLFGI